MERDLIGWEWEDIHSHLDDELRSQRGIFEMVNSTCQVCGREIKASTGLIAHHGYKRPYHAGWQTASCEGARYVPYEVSCDRLREVVELVRDFVSRQEKELAAFLAEPPQTLIVYERRSSWKGEEEKVTYEKPEGFDKDRYYGIPHTYEVAYSSRRYRYEQTLKMAKIDLATMERRLAEWKPQEVA